jgi:hypothetical protein
VPIRYKHPIIVHDSASNSGRLKKLASKSSVSSKRKAFAKAPNNKTQFFGAIGVRKKASNTGLKKFEKESQQSSTGNESSVYKHPLLFNQL